MTMGPNPGARARRPDRRLSNVLEGVLWVS
jgi:hypothetical protein